MTDTPDMNEVMADAVQQAASLAYPGDLVTRWVALVETLTSAARSSFTSCQPGMKPWDSLGMLTFAIQMEQAATVREDQ